MRPAGPAAHRPRRSRTARSSEQPGASRGDGAGATAGRGGSTSSGLASDGRVHASDRHLCGAPPRGLTRRGVPRAAVHAITDGRDTSPRGGKRYLARLEEAGGPAAGSPVVGRYYAMDRDKRWDRTHGHAMPSRGEGRGPPARGGDRRPPTTRGDHRRVRGAGGHRGQGKTPVASSATATRSPFFNFRADRARQITRALVDRTFRHSTAETRPQVHYVCMARYDEDVRPAPRLPPARAHEHPGRYRAARGKKTLRMAETEKYAHVTYFFNGGEENEFGARSGSSSPPEGGDLRPAAGDERERSVRGR